MDGAPFQGMRHSEGGTDFALCRFGSTRSSLVMIFSSTLFVFLYLPFVLIVHGLAPQYLQNAVLLVVSLIYYGWGEYRFVPVLSGLIVVNYGLGLLLSGQFRQRTRKGILLLAVVVDVGVLVYFKYAEFLLQTAHGFLALLSGVHGQDVPKTGLLPLGISFFTFHVLSYVIDIYRRQVRAQRNPALLCLYIVLFPQLIAGPIVRYHEIAGQLSKRFPTMSDRFTGIARFIVGLGKKVLLANTIGPLADAVFSIPSNDLTANLAWLGVTAYTLQIYFDFSGYSDMAIGLARWFGFRFPENFDYPYVARSMTEFWRRWHMSLSRWFRDYLYMTLGGNRVSPARTYVNLVLVFVLCGFWHGASWNFVFWGLLHGGFLILERSGFGRVLAGAWSPLRRFYCLSVIGATWVVFRATTLGMALAMLKAVVGLGTGLGTVYRPAMFLDNERLLAITVAVIGATPFLGWLRGRLPPLRDRWRLQLVFDVGRLAGLSAVLLLSAMQLSSGTYNPFIYFRF